MTDTVTDLQEPADLFPEGAAAAPRPTTSADLVPVEPTALADADAEGSLKGSILAMFKGTEPAVARIVARHRGVVHDLTTPAGLAAAREARHELRERVRFPLQRAAAAVKKALNSLKPLAEAEAERLIAEARIIEDKLHADITAREEEIAAEKERQRQAEAARVAKHEANLAAIRQALELAADKTPEQIEGAARRLGEFTPGEDWQEYAPRALQAAHETVDALLALAEQKRADAAAAAARAEAEAVAARQAQELEAMQAAARAAQHRDQLLADWAEYAERGPVESDQGADLVRGLIAGIESVDVSTFGPLVRVARMAQSVAIVTLKQHLSDWETRPVIPAPETAPAPTATAWAETSLPQAVADLAAAVETDDPVSDTFASSVVETKTAPTPYPLEQYPVRVSTFNDALGFTVTAAFITDTLRLPARATIAGRPLWSHADLVEGCNLIAAHCYTVAADYEEKHG